MKTLTLVVAALVSMGLGAGDALAFSCPNLVKAANEAIAKAETAAGQVSGDREKVRAAGMVAEAKELVKEAEAAHSGGQHGRSEAKAKAAQYLAEQVK
ncbi:MAG: hypothetical protein ACREMB_09615 [Candidatus Rokuibacteriota bacterium]